MASRVDLTPIALRVLEDALAKATHGPVQRDWGQRLALSWLQHAGIAEDWQCRSFWRLLAENDEGEVNGCRGYVRMTRLTGALTCWYGNAGLAIPEGVDRERWAKKAQQGQPERGKANTIL